MGPLATSVDVTEMEEIDMVRNYVSAGLVTAEIACADRSGTPAARVLTISAAGRREAQKQGRVRANKR